MFRHLFRLALAVTFLLLLAVPFTFYRYGFRGALRETGLVLVSFALAVYFGHFWVRKVLVIDQPPVSLDARILVGLTLTTVFLAFGNAYLLLGPVTGVILSTLQFSVLTGLLSSGLKQPAGLADWSAWAPGFWKKREYYPAMAIIATLTLVLVAGFWAVLRWWSLLVVPGMLLGNGLGGLMGRSLRRWLLALKQVWDMVRRMGPPIGAFALGYFVIAFIFAGVFASIWRADSAAFKGLPQKPTGIDFAYYSVMTISTTGYGDVSPQSSWAKLLASAEVLIGLAWTVVIFAAVLTVVQERRSEPSDHDDRDRV